MFKATPILKIMMRIKVSTMLNLPDKKQNATIIDVQANIEVVRLFRLTEKTPLQPLKQ